ncbi:hypothetical protein HYW60_01625 [Candidatus Kaiserbacteria bacterium]|nr:hypothetical protein [Candidatus Kaiserbacteria bacterium]
MIVRVLIGFAIVTLAVLIFLWLATGGVQEIATIARGITNPLRIFSGGLSSFRLPWQPEQLTRGPIVNAGEEIPGTEGTQEHGAPEEELAGAQKEYDAIVKEMQSAQNFGEPSPYRGQVTLMQASAAQSGASEEYMELEAAWDNTAPVKISGWSLQSALTGIRAYVPRGAHPFILGSVNIQNDIYLDPGSSAILPSGASPLGTSFRENACTGYLGRLQSFTPPLERVCPAPRDELPFTPENIRTYGEACFDFVQTITSCTFPADVPSNVSPACHLFLANNLSYNGCTQNHRHESDFARNTWRMYLNAGGELWRNSHDIIRLLDQQGRTVDMVSY